MGEEEREKANWREGGGAAFICLTVRKVVRVSKSYCKGDKRNRVEKVGVDW